MKSSALSFALAVAGIANAAVMLEPRTFVKGDILYPEQSGTLHPGQHFTFSYVASQVGCRLRLLPERV